MAYAVAEKLGYPKDRVNWNGVGSDEAIAKQDGWDFDINQFTITPERAQVVDFSSGYYDVTQTLITVKGPPISGATTIGAVNGRQAGRDERTRSWSKSIFHRRDPTPVITTRRANSTNIPIAAITIGQPLRAQ